MTEPAPTPEATPEPNSAATPEAPKPGSEPSANPAEEAARWKAKFEGAESAKQKWESTAKADFEDAKAWREYQESKKTDDEKREQRERELEERATKAESKLLRSDVADAKKVPVEWREFLTGTTQEELEASADKILTLIADKKGTTPDPNQGNPTGEPPADFLRAAARR